MLVKSEYILYLEREIKRYREAIEPKKGKGFNFMF